VLPREVYERIRKIEIYSSRMVEDQLAGQYQSVFKGRGMAFSEVRPYSPGDDVRIIDWNVSARMNAPHVKLFTEERDRTVMLLIDMSASGLFGSQARSKREIAAEVAALIAFSAVKNRDRVGLIVITDQVELCLPPRHGQRHVLRVIREILTHTPRSPHTALGAGLEYLGKVMRHRSVAFLISDFVDTSWEQALKIAGQRHDLIPVIIADPMEARLPDLGLVMVEDVETGEVLEFDTAGPEADEYAAMNAQTRAHRESFLRRHKIDFVNVWTNRPYVDALVAFFQARARRMKRG
jgi:uncharacterized protein (DUF58 family)